MFKGGYDVISVFVDLKELTCGRTTPEFPRGNKQISSQEEVTSWL